MYEQLRGRAGWMCEVGRAKTRREKAESRRKGSAKGEREPQRPDSRFAASLPGPPSDTDPGPLRGHKHQGALGRKRKASLARGKEKVLTTVECTD